jgi:hypothetical protein
MLVEVMFAVGLGGFACSLYYAVKHADDPTRRSLRRAQS